MSFFYGDIKSDEIQTTSSIKIKEISSAPDDTAAFGQVWVKTATPNELYNGTFNKREFKHILKIKLLEQRKIRREKFHNCQKCQKKYFREQSFWS